MRIISCSNLIIVAQPSLDIWQFFRETWPRSNAVTWGGVPNGVISKKCNYYPHFVIAVYLQQDVQGFNKTTSTRRKFVTSTWGVASDGLLSENCICGIILMTTVYSQLKLQQLVRLTWPRRNDVILTDVNY